MEYCIPQFGKSLIDLLKVRRRVRANRTSTLEWSGDDPERREIGIIPRARFASQRWGRNRESLYSRSIRSMGCTERCCDLLAVCRGTSMRTHLLTTTAVMALLAAMPAQAQDATWQLTPVSGDFNTAANWNPAAVPTGTAFFGASANKNLTFNLGAANSVGQFLFNFSPAGAYSFTLAPLSSLTFTGAGIQNFAGIGVQINNNGNLTFAGASSAGDATITNNFQLLFTNTSTAGNATITTNGITTFAGNSTGGNAQLITNAGANLTFEFTTGPNGDNQITAGSIAGAGNYILPGKTLTVGSNNLSTDVSGQIIGAGGSRSRRAVAR
jgi:hypothetical protein